MNHSTIARALARAIRLFVVAALLAAMGTIAAPPPVAQASTFDVDTDIDNPALKACTAAPGDCSLRGAIPAIFFGPLGEEFGWRASPCPDCN